MRSFRLLRVACLWPEGLHGKWVRKARKHSEGWEVMHGMERAKSSEQIKGSWVWERLTPWEAGRPGAAAMATFGFWSVSVTLPRRMLTTELTSPFQHLGQAFLQLCVLCFPCAIWIPYHDGDSDLSFASCGSSRQAFNCLLIHYQQGSY